MTIADATRQTLADNEDNRNIIKAFRFLEDLTQRINSLEEAILSGLKSSDRLTEMNIKLFDFDEDCTMVQSEWLYRSGINTFKVRRVHPGRATAHILGALQISLAPPEKGADDSFFPHVVLLLSETDGCDQWECEDFVYDDSFLLTENEDHDPWRTEDGLTWVGADGNWKGSALVVPLVRLETDTDVKNLVITPTFDRIDALLKELGR